MDASPRQIALYGHIAERLRDELAKRQWTPADLNEALGLARQAPAVYLWLRGVGGPGLGNQQRLLKLFGGPAESFARRRVSRPAADDDATADVLTFNANGNGKVRIRLDATLPADTAVSLLRLLLDAGLVFTTNAAEGA